MIQPQELKDFVYSNISDEIAWLSATMFWDHWVRCSIKKTITYWILKQVNHLIELLKLTLNHNFDYYQYDLLNHLIIEFFKFSFSPLSVSFARKKVATIFNLSCMFFFKAIFPLVFRLNKTRWSLGFLLHVTRLSPKAARRRAKRPNYKGDLRISMSMENGLGATF